MVSTRRVLRGSYNFSVLIYMERQVIVLLDIGGTKGNKGAKVGVNIDKVGVGEPKRANISTV